MPNTTDRRRIASNAMIVTWNVGFALIALSGVSIAGTTWQIEKKTSRMTGTTSVSAFVDASEPIGPIITGYSNGKIRPKFRFYCFDNQVWPGVDYGFGAAVGGSSVHIMWRVGNSPPIKEKNWFVTQTGRLVSPERNKSDLLVKLIENSPGSLAFQLNYIGLTQNSLNDPDSTFAEFSLSGVLGAIRAVSDACDANKPVPTGALSRGVEGYVTVQFTIRADGRTANPIVIFSTSSLFERSAMKSILGRRYEETGRSFDGVQENVKFTIPE